jgi:hypothetical protein
VKGWTLADPAAGLLRTQPSLVHLLISCAVEDKARWFATGGPCDHTLAMRSKGKCTLKYPHAPACPVHPWRSHGKQSLPGTLKEQGAWFPGTLTAVPAQVTNTQTSFCTRQTLFFEGETVLGFELQAFHLIVRCSNTSPNLLFNYKKNSAWSQPAWACNLELPYPCCVILGKLSLRLCSSLKWG